MTSEFKWACPACGAKANAHGKGGRCAVEPEPVDVQCAKALGFETSSIGPLHTRYASGHWWRSGPGKRWRRTPPIFALNAAWVVRMIEANRLALSPVAPNLIRVCNVEGKIVRSEGPTLGDAVVAWVVAAHEAGIEVRRG